MNNLQFTPYELILFTLTAIVWLWQFSFLIRRIVPVVKHKPPINTSNNLPPVSVIICARNEAENLEKFLPHILRQDYPEFQVVVVNDGSEDESDLILARLKAKYNNLYYTTIAPDRKFSHGKKLPLSLGIKAAKYEHLLLTDADCRPASDQWIKKMAQNFNQPGIEMVLGIGNYDKTKGLNNLWLRYDTFTIAIQYLGYALSGKPYMGIGRNIGYTKSLFEKNNGFKSHIYLASGDDDLFVQEAATASNTAVCIDPLAHTISTPPPTFQKWLDQKKRHLTTSKRYKNNIKSAIFFESVTREAAWILSGYFIFFPNLAPIFLPFLLLLFLAKFILWKMAARKTGMGKIFRGFLLFDFVQPVLLAFAHLGNLTGSKKRKWK
ncbi:glycosyltransferase [Thermophagus sp. OGC60D27]|uniref:glycosyltransferase n=1 Tax=Thermophagus sp. OGC60D27 TaxID=3458415 RepID=UPI0040382FDC